jgi:2-polyprenyl-3-methyl-5-hydroxy-6-metoxy-1,4-benzoquinol methylase
MFEGGERTCESCKCADLRLLRLRPTLAYWICRQCRHCLKENVVDSDRDFRSAQEFYFGAESALLQDHPSIIDLEILAERRRLVDERLCTGSSTIEVGPGAGFFAEWLIAAGHRVTLFEQSPALADHLRSRLGVDVETDALESRAADIAPVDAFFSFQVIEHVIDPLRHLQAGFDAVEQGGLGFVSTPNAASWQQRAFSTLSPNFDEAHLRVFSVRSLKGLCAAAGWEVIAEQTPEYTSGWLRVLSKALRQLKREDEARTAGKYAEAASSRFEKAYEFIRFVTAPLRHLQRRLNGGNELLLILRKPKLPPSMGSDRFRAQSQE